jgi:outer membrane protein OmpA-like peptidoglycan-associated protein
VIQRRRSGPHAPFVALALFGVACPPKQAEEEAPAPPMLRPVVEDAPVTTPGRPIPTVDPVHFAAKTMTNRVNIDKAATHLKNDPELELLLIGRTDSYRTPAAKNLERGMRRADEVADDIIRRVGVDASRIHVGSRGQANPAASNETAEGRAANRRVEFYFFYPDGEPLSSRFDFRVVIRGEEPPAARE